MSDDVTQTATKMNHVAIIMDGNGRWASERYRPRFWGHIRGSSVVAEIVEEADDLSIGALTLYAFSSENWSRPVGEIEILFKLLKKYLKAEKSRILSNNLRFKVIGDIGQLPSATIRLIKDLEYDSQKNSGMRLTFAFNYGGRDEIIHAINSSIKASKSEKISAEDIGRNLYLPELGDVDLLIRTGGEQRISNFLLWQAAYAELAFTSTKWPAFTKEEFRDIYYSVLSRERRFGDIGSSISLDNSTRKANTNRSLIEQARG